MSPVVLLCTIIFSLGILLVFGVIIVTLLKHLQRNYFPKWTFLDYISVDYFQHLWKKYIRRM